MDKIASVINSCNTYAHLMAYRELLTNTIQIEGSMLSYYYGMIDFRKHQLEQAGWSKITGENRFPCDDEHREKQEPPQSDGPY